MKKPRFNDKGFEQVYQEWLRVTPEQIKRILVIGKGSNRDKAFRDGYHELKCMYQRNWLLYPVYCAGKEIKRREKEEERWKRDAQFEADQQSII